MKEIKCPKCGNMIAMDEADYALILNQVRNNEFEAELERRSKLLEERFESEKALASSKLQNDFDKKLNACKDSVATLKNRRKSSVTQKDCIAAHFLRGMKMMTPANAMLNKLIPLI